MHNKNAGNVLFLILIAVALFAALSYAVTKSTSGGGNANAELATLNASSLLQYSTSIATTITRMQINGVSETDFCFYTGSNHADYNHAACSNDANNIFHADGGGATYTAPDSKNSSASDWEFNGLGRVWGQGLTTSSADASDLTMILRGVTDETCAGVNKAMGIPDIPVDGGDLDVNRFAGTYILEDNMDGCPSNCANMAASPWGSKGIHVGCFEEATGGDNVFFHTLIAR